MNFRFYNSWQADNKLFLLTKYCEDGDLAQLIKDRNGSKFSYDQLIDMFLQLADAVKCCHMMKLIHRDIKVRLFFWLLD